MSLRRSSMTALLATAFLTTATAAGEMTPGLTRLATVPLGAEITGLYITPNGDLFLNAQHPADSNPAPNNRATIGVMRGVNFNALPASISSVKVPSTPEEKQGFLTAIGSYEPLAREGDFDKSIPGGLGAILSADGSKLKQSNKPDFNAYIPVSRDKNEGYLFTNWEDRPGGMSRIRVRKAAAGAWSVDDSDAVMLDFRSVNGTWVNCFGSVSPWGTPLTSEELYFDDTADWNNAEYKYHKDQQALEKHIGRFPNPYDYGYIVEITDPAGRAAPVKHYSLGRYSHENSVVMPDMRTVYLTDDGTDVVFYKFIADVPGNLGSGTLYAAKVTQDAGTDPASVGFNVEWIELAHGNNSKIHGWIREYDGITPADYKADATSYISDAEVTAWAAGKAKDNRVAFLESRKAAKSKGATAEFRKMEGIMINHQGAADGSIPYMYMAMSEVGKGMADGKGDVRLDANKCGVVYQLKLDRDYDVARMKPAVAGFGYNKDAQSNQCSLGGISNPDNLLVLRDGRVLIGEDTGNHENNMLWLYDPDASS